MGVLNEILNIIFGAILLSIFLAVGLLRPENSLLDNIVVGIVMFIIVRILTLIFRSKR